ncbi:hypothetical protein PMIN03_008826 [Paraphaeosphaeria minitans]
MPEITFIFGPNNSFFFDCPKTWKFHNIPPTLRQLFNSSMAPAWRIAQPFCLALAPPQMASPEPVWYVGCKVLTGEEKICESYLCSTVLPTCLGYLPLSPMWSAYPYQSTSSRTKRHRTAMTERYANPHPSVYSQAIFDSHYPSLSAWTKTIPNAPRSCYVTFGTGYSYFASAPGRGSVWADIPSELSDKIQKAYDTPCCVAMGVNQAWFVLWPDGYCSWKFYGGYAGLDGILRGAEPRSVTYLAISPYNPNHYFVAFRNRTVQYNFTGAPPEWMAQMNDVFAQWQADIAQAQSGTPHAAPPAQQVQVQGLVQPYLASPIPPGMLCPPSPITPLSQQSNVTSPSLSPHATQPPHVPQVYAHYAPPPAPTAAEMPGSLPAGVMLEPPPPPPAARPSSINVKRKKFFLKIFD